jgi:hypothetical protein
LKIFGILENMDAKFFLRFIVLAALPLILALPVEAHLPRMEGANAEIKIERPEISQAFYGWLEGKPAIYSINAKAPFLLYVGLLSPRVEFLRTDFSAVIRKDGELFSRVSAEDSLWPVVYEPFTNDYYAKGPEWEQKVLAGKYEIEISNSGNNGSYSLAVGKTEDLSLGGFLRTLAVLPHVKEKFFGVPWWQAYNNLVGLAALIFLVFLSAAAYFTASFFKNRRLKKKLDEQYAKHFADRNAGGAAGG